MNPEPQALASISRNRRDTRILKGRLLALPALVTAGCIGFFLYSCNRGWMSGADVFDSSKLIKLIPLMALIFIGALFLLYGWYRLLFGAPRSFDYFTMEARACDAGEFKRYNDRLEAVSIAVGVRKPGLVVLSLPTANAVSFMKDEEACVGITAELLENNLKSGQVEALMAYQLSHIIEGHVAEPPRLRRLKSFVSLVIYPICAISIFLAAIAIPSDRSGVLLAISICSFFLFLALLIFLANQYKRFRMLHFASDILADSIACEITQNPRAMISTIEEMDALMEGSEEVPEDATYFKYLFTFPREPESGWAGSIRHKPLLIDPDSMSRDLKREERLSEAIARVRIKNLEAIETGHWRDYEWKQWKELIQLYSKQGS